MDLLDFFRGVHPWRKLDNLILSLLRRSTSELLAELADDDEAAALLTDKQLNGTGTKPAGPRLTEYSPEARRLDVLIYRLGQLLVQQPQMHGVSVSPPDPEPTPETAYDRERKRRAARRLDALRTEVIAAIGRQPTA